VFPQHGRPVPGDLAYQEVAQMIASARTLPTREERFLDMLPQIRERARHAFRNEQPERRRLKERTGCLPARPPEFHQARPVELTQRQQT
jgi:hypothetical protein